MNVLFPLPFGPTRATSSPRRSPIDTPWTTTAFPYPPWMSSASKMNSPLPSLSPVRVDDAGAVPRRLELRCKARRRLVEEHELRLAHEGAGHFEELHLAPGDVRRPVQRDRLQLVPLQCVEGVRGGRGLPVLPSGGNRSVHDPLPFLVPRRDERILEDRHPAEQPRVLEAPNDASREHVPRVEPVNPLPAERDRSRIGLVHA